MRVFKVAIPAVVLLASVVGIQAQTVQTTLNYPLGVSGVAVDYVANRVYILLPDYYGNGSSAVQVLDCLTNTVTHTFPVPVSSAIAVDVVTSKVFVAGTVPSATSPSGTEAEVIDVGPVSAKVHAVIPVTSNAGTGLIALSVDSLHGNLFVSNSTDNAIAVINSHTDTLTTSVPLTTGVPAGLAVNIFTGVVYVGLGTNRIAIYNSLTGSLRYSVYGSNTYGIAVDPITDHEFVTDAVFNHPTAGILLSGGGRLERIPVGLYPQGIDVDWATGNVFVANEADGTVSVIDEYTGAVTNTISVPANLITANPRTQNIYVTGPTSVTVLAD